MQGRLLYRKHFSEKRTGLVSICPSQSAGVTIGCHPFEGPANDRMELKTVQLSDMFCFDATWSNIRPQIRFLKNADAWNAENNSGDGIKHEPLPPHASFSAASWFHLAGLCVKERFCEWLPSAKTVGFRCARGQIACPAKQIGYRVLLHTSGSCRPKRARTSQEKKLYLSFAQTKWCIPTAESSRPVNIVFAMKGRLLHRKHFSEKRKGLVSMCPS